MAGEIKPERRKIVNNTGPSCGRFKTQWSKCSSSNHWRISDFRAGSKAYSRKLSVFDLSTTPKVSNTLNESFWKQCVYANDQIWEYMIRLILLLNASIHCKDFVNELSISSHINRFIFREMSYFQSKRLHASIQPLTSDQTFQHGRHPQQHCLQLFALQVHKSTLWRISLPQTNCR